MPAKTTDHILLIDPDILDRENTAAFLEDSGYKITALSDGLEAMNWLKNEIPDLIVTEMNLEHYNGLEIIEKATKQENPIPVIVATSAYEQELVVQAMRLGITDYLVKPIPDLKLLQAVIKQALDRQRLINENKKFQQILMEDQEAGSLVQSKSLAKSPHQKNDYMLEFLVQPMLYLSGDVIDYIEVDDNYLIFYCADVSGHGSAAAFVTILIKMFIRDAVQKYRIDADRKALTPHLLVADLAHEVYTAKLDKYCTILYFVYDKQLEELHYTIGGQYPNPIVYQDGKARYLEGKGFPVGIASSLKYETKIIEIQAPFELYLFSDGIFELMTGDFDNKDAHLLAVIEQGNRSVAALSQFFKVQTTKDPLDDTSILVFKKGVPVDA
jgi:serine phosphatase RsbU (regulator of sigma subunit)